MREQLIRVFTDTVSHIENGEYNKDLHCSKNRLSSIELDSDIRNQELSQLRILIVLRLRVAYQKKERHVCLIWHLIRAGWWS